LKFVNITSHAGRLYALTDTGALYQHAPNPNWRGGPANTEPSHIWQSVALPVEFADQSVFKEAEAMKAAIRLKKEAEKDK
jgi:hypothetical protein